MTFITLKTFTDTHDAYILKGHLEHNGIKCFLKNEKLIAAEGPFNGYSGVEVQVLEEDLNKAQKILKNKT